LLLGGTAIRAVVVNEKIISYKREAPAAVEVLVLL